jgi:metal-responsive CopG/Arc/MetJ family transcriptional regulator
MRDTMGRPPIYGKRLLVAVDQAFLDRLDAWRAKERDLPNRSEAIRRIVLRATEPEPKPSKKSRRSS